MPQIEIYFDGYCPESMLKGKQVEMRLNKSDFWESLETGLQMTIFPPYAVILKWRGTGDFRVSTDFASDSLFGLVFTEASNVSGWEFLADEKKLLHNAEEIEQYLSNSYKSFEDYNASNASKQS